MLQLLMVFHNVATRYLAFRYFRWGITLTGQRLMRGLAAATFVKDGRALSRCELLPSAAYATGDLHSLLL